MIQRILLWLLPLLMLSSVAAAQENSHRDTPQALTIGDTVEMTLQPDERVRFLLDMAPGESFLLQSPDEDNLNWQWDFFRPGLDDPNFHTWPLDRRLVIGNAGDHALEILNSEPVEHRVQFELMDVPTRAIELGERYIFAEDDPEIFELSFSLDEDQSVAIESNGGLNASYVERISQPGVADFRSLSGTVLPTYGLILQPGDYRIVTSWGAWATGDETPYIELRPTSIVGGQLVPGDVVQQTADVQPVQYTLNLDAGEPFYAAIASTGAQAYITDAEGALVDFYGHGGVPHEYASLGFIAPEAGTYTLNVYHPAMDNAMNGEFIIVTGDTEIPRLDYFEGTPTFDIATGDARYLYNRISRFNTYRVAIATVNGEAIDGAIGIEVIKAPSPASDGEADPAPSETLLHYRLRCAILPLPNSLSRPQHIWGFW